MTYIVKNGVTYHVYVLAGWDDGYAKYIITGNNKK